MGATYKGVQWNGNKIVYDLYAIAALAAFIAEKFGGDTMADVATNVAAYQARIAAAPPAPVAGRPHGLSGTDEAGSGGDD